jgi:hypothetical protein
MGHIPQSEYAGYQVHPYAYSQYIKGAKPVLMDFLQQGEDWGGTSKVDYDELYRRAKENELKAYYIPDKDLYNRIYEGYGGQGSPSGFHRGDEIFMSTTPENIPSTLAHETGHEYFGHKYETGGQSSVPELTQYQKADRALLGLLPSFQEYAFRPSYVKMKPEMKKRFKSRKEYNERMEKLNYNPLFADAPFEKFDEKMVGSADYVLKERLTTNWTQTDKGWKKTKDIPLPIKDKSNQKPFYIF